MKQGWGIGSILFEQRNLKPADQYAHIARLWESVAYLFMQAGEKEDIKYIKEAAEVLKELSELERAAMESLKTASS